MYQIFLLVCRVIRTIFTKRHIPDYHVKGVILKLGILVSLVLYVCQRIEIMRYSCGQAVKLNAVYRAVFSKFMRHISEKVTRSHSWVNDMTALETKMLQSLVYALNYVRFCVECGGGTCSCRIVFFLGKQAFQFDILG